VIVTLVLAVILMALAFVPAVQTWVVQTEINRQPGWQGSVGSISARFGKIAASDLHLEYGGAALVLPLVDASLPLTAAVWERKYLVQGLTAKGWTLDLTHLAILNANPIGAGTSPTGGAGGTGSSLFSSDQARMTVQVLGGILGRWNLPWDLSLDGLDLEGDVLVAGPQQVGSVKVHVTAKGGGMATGREGVIQFTADGVGLDARNQPVGVNGMGRIAARMASPRNFSRIAVKGDLSVKGGSLPDGLTLSAEVTADRATHEETGTFDLAGNGHHLANMAVRNSAPTGPLTGNWKIELRDSDLRAFLPDRALPGFSAVGEGTLDGVPDWTRLHAAGRLTTVLDRPESLAPLLAGLGPVTLETRFDLTHAGLTLRLGSVDMTIAGAHPIATVHLLQPVEWDELSWRPSLPDPATDAAAVTVQGFPVALFSGLYQGVTLTGNEASGAYVLGVAGDTVNLRPTIPLTAGGVSVRAANGFAIHGLEMSLSLLANWGSDGWQCEWTPLTLTNSGRTWATSTGKASRTGKAGQPVVLSATWDADLDALATQPGFDGRRWIKGRSASGEFTASLGGFTRVEGKFTATGHNASDSLAGNVSAEFGPNRPVRFHAPFKISVGSEASDVLIEGSVTGPAGGSRVDLTLSGKSASLEQLRALADPLLGAAGFDSGIVRSAAGTPAAIAAVEKPRPFWGDWTGPVTLDFDRLRAGGHTFDYVRGTLNLSRNAIRLDHGLVKLVPDKMTTVDGELSFDPDTVVPYLLKAGASLGEMDAVPLVSETPPAGDPVITGRFTVASSLAGAGASLDDLLAHTREEFRLTSHGGAFRLLKTDVAGAIPPPPDSGAVADALGSVGSAVGKFFGSDRRARGPGSGLVKLGKNTQAVLDFSYAIAEFSYDQLTLTAIREADGSIRLEDLALTAAEVDLTGSGSLGHKDGLALRAQPLTLDLQLGARNAMATLLTTGGLLSSHKDSLGYTLMEEPIHLSGTLAHIDDSQWRAALAEAAKPKPDAGAKSGTTPATAKP